MYCRMSGRSEGRYTRWPGSEAEWPQCWRRAPSSEKRRRGAASKGAARRGEDAALVLMLRGVLGALSVSLQPRAHPCDLLWNMQDWASHGIDACRASIQGSNARVVADDMPVRL